MTNKTMIQDREAFKKVNDDRCFTGYAPSLDANIRLHYENIFLAGLNHARQESQKELETLKARNKLLEDGIDFYADKANWKRFFVEGLYPSYPRNVFTKEDCEEFCINYLDGEYEDIAGKLARQLKQSRIEG